MADAHAVLDIAEVEPQLSLRTPKHVAAAGSRASIGGQRYAQTWYYRHACAVGTRPPCGRPSRPPAGQLARAAPAMLAQFGDFPELYDRPDRQA